MSLDVYLNMPGIVRKQPTIYVREKGHTRSITRAEWDELHPGIEPVAVQERETDCVYNGNVTHNLSDMAEAAGIYAVLWRPDEHGITKARQLIDPLQTGLQVLLTDPDKYRAYNPKNQWGDYDDLVAFVSEYLAACVRWPDADVSVWR